MKHFNIGVEITDPAAMRAMALKRHLAQGYSEADFTAAEHVLWPEQPEAYWLTVIADSLVQGVASALSGRAVRNLGPLV
jgi:hypothetical protein